MTYSVPHLARTKRCKFKIQYAQTNRVTFGRDGHFCSFSLHLKTKMPKPNKSILKRIKITKNGKLIRRIAGQNHFNSKESRRTQRRKGRGFAVDSSFRKQVLAGVQQ